MRVCSEADRQATSADRVLRSLRVERHAAGFEAGGRTAVHCRSQSVELAICIPTAWPGSESAIIPLFLFTTRGCRLGKILTSILKKLGRLLGQAESIAPTLVIHPLRSAYTLYRFHDGEALRRYDDAFLRQVEQWKGRTAVPFFGDETMLAKAWLGGRREAGVGTPPL